MAAVEESLNRLLNRATIPTGPSLDWQAVDSFAQAIDTHEAVQSALRLLIHRIQSPCEKEALNGLLVLEVCAEKCGQGFQEEIGKFRFLNELIKVVSPKYLGMHTSPAVKQKVIELLYKWTQTIKGQLKIQDAYDMLKRQKVVVADPVPQAPTRPSPRPKNTIFDDDEKAKQLQKLLHSGNREDVLAANRLIKTMVKEDEKRAEKVLRRDADLETVKNNVKVLNDFLSTYESGGTSTDDLELIKELYQTCERLRPNLFRLASDTDEKDENLGDILKANDQLVRVIERYHRTMKTEPISNGEKISEKKDVESVSANISLLDLGSPSTESVDRRKSDPPSAFFDDQLLSLDDVLGSSASPPVTSDSAKSNLDELGDIFAGASAGNPPPPAELFEFNNLSMLIPTKSKSDGNEVSAHFQKSLIEKDSQEGKKSSNALEDLDALGQSLLKQALPTNITLGAEFQKPPEKVSMNEMKKHSTLSSSSSSSPQHGPLFPRESTEAGSPAHEPSPLTDIFIPLDSIKPGDTPPLTLLDKNGLNVVIHFGRDCPKPDVRVMVITSVNRSPDVITSFFFQAAVPKSMKLKLQPPSATQLPAFNPILPPAAITQVMLLACSSLEKVKLKYKITYTLNEKSHTQMGEVECLPLT